VGRKIVIDPGHIGGEWAKMEERHFHPDKNRPPVREGSHTLETSRILKGLLEARGATVVLLREKEEPVTPKRPADFMTEARAELTRMGLDPDRPAPDAPPQHYPKWQAEKLFYRTAEIRARAELVNETIRPDVVLCIHFDAGGWGSGSTFTDQNHLHMLLSGGFALDEVLLDDQRSEMLTKLLERTHEAEIPLAGAVGAALAEATGLPPRNYTSGAVAVPNQPYLWARNLLANRLYRCPVAFCEPYAMNHKDVYERLLAGDFEGQRDINGATRISIFREYAQAVAKGVEQYFASTN
jgi:N-acetylmuramoyl-L-alanine amidase